MTGIFLDTNILYNVLFRTQLTTKAIDLLVDNEDRRFYTSITVVNELLYISTVRHYKERNSVKGPLSLRKVVTREGYPESIISGIRSLLEDLEITLLTENVSHSEMLETVRELKLLPSDAVIALTCKRHGVDTIMTFDRDFERVPWLKLIS